MSVLKSDILCPYCLNELRGRDLEMICNVCGNPIIPSRSEILFKKVPKCKESGCHGIASERRCVHCENKLPPDILDYKKYLRFALVGITGAGKTNYVTTMLHEMRHAQGSPFVISPMDSTSTEIYQENDRAIYENRTPTNATLAGDTPPPQLWKLKDKSKMTKNSIASYSITIFDGAGEDLENIDPAISRYLNGSKSLIILIDPLALPNIAASIDPDILKRSIKSSHSATAGADIVNGLAQYIRNTCGIKSHKFIDKDVAVVFTKLDAVQHTFGHQATVVKPSPHLANKGFVLSDADLVSQEIRSWLEANQETVFLDAVETNFNPKRIRYFGVSSFGQPPTGEDQLGKVLPHRVLDPLMWLLSKEGIVPVK